MPDYSKGKIYKLWSSSKNLVYYGSTIQTLSQRLSGHRRKYINNNTKYDCSSYLVLECEDYKIELVEEYPCNNKQQLNKKEGEYQKKNECVNKMIAGRTQQEYYQDNKKEIYEKRKENSKEWAQNNKEKIAATQKKYYEKNKEKRNKYRNELRLKQKEVVKI